MDQHRIALTFWLGSRLVAGICLISVSSRADAGNERCEVFFDQRVDACLQRRSESAGLDQLTQVVEAAQQEVASKQAAVGAAAPSQKAAAQAALDTASQALAEAQAAVARADRAKATFEEQSCAAFEAGATPTNGHRFVHAAAVPIGACDLLASISGMIRAQSQLADLSGARTPSAEAREKLQAAAVAATTPETATSVNKSGSAAQLEPIETTRTIALAGGAVSLAGTDSGNQMIATISVNPLALGDPNDVRAQRALDITVTAPFNLDGAEDSLRFVGIRLRSNGTALFDYEGLRNSAREYAVQAGAFADRVQLALSEAPDVARCFDGITADGQAPADACGGAFDDLYVRKVRETAYRSLQAARRAADQYYWGLDVRLDIGTPETAEESNRNDVHLLTGLAGGGRLPMGEWDLEYRARAAADYFNPRADDLAGEPIDPVFSGDWGLGLVLAGRPTAAIAKQRLGFGLGLEGRHSFKDSASDLAPTNYLDLRAMIIVPTANGTDLGIGLRVPLEDSAIERGTVITVSGDFGLLAPDAQAKL